MPGCPCEGCKALWKAEEELRAKNASLTLTLSVEDVKFMLEHQVVPFDTYKALQAAISGKRAA